MSSGFTLGLELKSLDFAYDDYQVDFTLSLSSGKIMALVGASGAGKSTLLHLVAGLSAPNNGELSFCGSSLLPLAPYERPLSMLFQNNNLFAHLSVHDNIALGITPSLKLSAEQQQQVIAAAQDVGLAQKLDKLPSELSGGQQQRVALARCCVSDKPLWLLDEPFSALDPNLRIEMLALVKQLAQSREITVLMVTHQLSDALNIADEFAFIEHGQVSDFGSMRDLEAAMQQTDLQPRLSTALQAFLAASTQ